MNDEKKDFIISRIFDSSRDIVWKAWPEQDRLMHWFGPKRFTMSVDWLDFLKDRTTVTVRWRPLDATEEERRTFDASHDGMRQGWSGTFDQPAEYLEAPVQKECPSKKPAS